MESSATALTEAQAHLQQLRQRLERSNPALYRDLALYLQVLRAGLPQAVLQATFHLATQVVPARYTALDTAERLGLQQRLQQLVQRCNALLTVEQLIVLARQVRSEQQRLRRREQRRLLAAMAAAAGQATDDSNGDDTPGPSGDGSGQDSGQAMDLPRGSVQLGMDLPLSADLFAAGLPGLSGLSGLAALTSGSEEEGSRAAAYGGGNTEEEDDVDEENAADDNAESGHHHPDDADADGRQSYNSRGYKAQGYDNADEDGPDDDDTDDDALTDADDEDDDTDDTDDTDDDDADADPDGVGRNNQGRDDGGRSHRLHRNRSGGHQGGGRQGGDRDATQAGSGFDTAGEPAHVFQALFAMASEAMGRLPASARDADDSDDQDLHEDSEGGAAPASASPTGPDDDSEPPYLLPRQPLELLHWWGAFDLALQRRLRNLSHAINLELLRLGLTRSLLPASLLDAVLRGQIEALPAPANLLRLSLPFSPDGMAAPMEALGLLLRGPDLEAEQPRLRTCRRRLEERRSELRTVARNYRHWQRRTLALEAEQQWLQDSRMAGPVQP